MTDKTEPRYPEIVVQLSGQDGNALAIIGRMTNALRRGKIDSETRQEFMDEAQAGDYDALLVTCMNWVTVE